MWERRAFALPDCMKPPGNADSKWSAEDLFKMAMNEELESKR